MTQALRLCAEGRDRVLGGQILAGLSHLATNLGRPDEGWPWPRPVSPPRRTRAARSA